MKTSNLFAFLGGAALGAATALLLAPESGSKTRKKLKRKLKKYEELGADELNDLVKRIKIYQAKRSIKEKVD